MKTVTICFKNRPITEEKEVIKNVLGFSFFGEYMVFDIATGKDYVVRSLSEIDSYRVVEDPLVSPYKKKK